MQHEKPGTIDLDACLSDPLLRDVVLAQRLAERDARAGPAAHQLQRPLRHANLPHAVMNASGPQPPLRDLEAASLAKEQV